MSETFHEPAVDPWKGFRGVMAGVLILEAIVVLLTYPVVAKIGGGLSWWSGLYIGLLALALIAGAGLQRRSWALQYNLALQVVFVLGWFVHLWVGVMGLVFVVVWLYVLYVRREIQRRYARGLLPGQRD